MSDQSTKEKIQNDLIKFMKSGEKDKVEIIRFAQSFIKQLEKDKNIELSETETIQVLKKVIKRNQESFDQFIKAGRDELAAQEKKEMDIIKLYLPEEMSEADVINLVKNSIANCKAETIKDMGKVMTDIKKTNGESIDMTLVSKYVKQLLSS
ncbi:MAG: GatB/YqeY domain-containing protein [Pseudomonadota bacterium]|nr:GatB/YqeY domain-containing protein [Pseudomonadota bacterium]|tara:strand:- start:6833 stop:7288 length:456 start_codon:yes stop_codon:yes gene_type:complete